MIKHSYTVQDARREVREALAEGYGFNYVRIFINDLERGKLITWAEGGEIMRDLVSGVFGDVTCSVPTLTEEAD